MSGSQKARLFVLIFGLVFTLLPLSVELYYLFYKQTILLFLPSIVMFPGGLGALYAVSSKKTNWAQYD